MKNCKVYKDGSHYIAIRPTEGAGRDRRVLPPEECIIVDESSDVTDSMPWRYKTKRYRQKRGRKSCRSFRLMKSRRKSFV